MSGQGVKAGDAYVEVGGRTAGAERAIEGVQQRVRGIGRAAQSALSPSRLLMSAYTGGVAIFAGLSAAAYGAVRGIRALGDWITDLDGRIAAAKEQTKQLSAAMDLENKAFLVSIGIEKQDDLKDAQGNLTRATERYKELLKEFEEIDRKASLDTFFAKQDELDDALKKIQQMREELEWIQRERMGQEKWAEIQQRQADIDAQYRDAEADRLVDVMKAEDEEEAMRQRIAESMAQAQREVDEIRFQRRLKELEADPDSIRERVSTRGQFGGGGAAMAFGGIGGQTFEKQLKVQERMDRTLAQIEDNTRSMGGVLT